ncbi:MAG: GNAT family N-acetyltransferase [Acidobacteria bacterium]|nr:GNAT family N-acetyltransferase [Acidobacteriota bacterium]
MAIIRTIETAAGFEELRTEWNELLQACGSNCFFLTWEWLFTWWKYLSQGRDLFLVTARCGAELAAIAPLSRKPARFPALWPFQTLEFLGTGNVGSDYLDLIVRPDKEQEILPALAEYLAGKRSSLSLAQVNKDSCIAKEFARHWEKHGPPLREAGTNVCPAICLAGHSWDSYLGTLGSEHRYNFRRKWKHLTSHFDVRFDLAASEEERKEALRILLSLHASRWGERSDAFVSPQLVAFHDELSSLALERGWLRLFTLRLDDTPVASLYGFYYDRVFYFYQSGFDIGYSKHSVGLIVMGLAIQNAIREGAREYDLLHGNEGYKSHWASQTRELGRLELFPPGLAGMAWKQARGASQAAKRVARDVLPQAWKEKLAEVRRKRAVKGLHVSYSRQDRRFTSLTLERDRSVGSEAE